MEFDLKYKAEYIKYLKYHNLDYSCQVCGTKDESLLTRHHKIRKSIKLDNSVENLVPLCRSCHDVVEKFYDWIISLNIPSLAKRAKILREKNTLAISILNGISHGQLPGPTKFEVFGFNENFVKKNKFRDLKMIFTYVVNSSKADLNEINREINSILLEKVDFNELYSNSIEYARKKL